MPTSGKPVEDQLSELHTQVQRLLSHTDTNRRQREEGVAAILKDMQTEIAKLSVKADPKPERSDWKGWLAIFSPIVLIVGFIYAQGKNDESTSQSILRVQTEAANRSAQIETDLRARILAVENNLRMGTTLQNQQVQGLTDQVRLLQAADQTGGERLGAMAQSLATITAQLQAQTVRMDEVLRRQDRLESRLSARPGAAEPPEQPTLYPRSL